MTQATTKHIGIIAVSAEGAALCYRTICKEGAEALGRHTHPVVTMHTVPLAKYMEAIDEDRWDLVADLLLRSARILAEAGADFLICPDNTVHRAFDWIGNRAPLPWLHIAEVVAETAAEKGYRRVGLLGTRYLMESPVYPNRLAHVGIEHVIPDEADREKINSIIFDELVYARFEDATREFLEEVMKRLQTRGCDAIVMACTELPLILRQQDSPLPLLDSTRLLARKALKEAVKGEAR
ncbi:MAG: amino acid racemase [Candidatus Eiseniibacteriota bacterium]|jgi:aspartate racemase